MCLTLPQVQLLQWPLRSSKHGTQQLYATGWFHPKQLIPVSTTQAAALMKQYGHHESITNTAADQSLQPTTNDNTVVGDNSDKDKSSNSGRLLLHCS
jgi:hypothetical protein